VKKQKYHELTKADKSDFIIEKKLLLLQLMQLLLLALASVVI
jgi:hypothetical protein